MYVFMSFINRFFVSMTAPQPQLEPVVVLSRVQNGRIERRVAA